MRYQVEVTLSSNGYITVDAENEDAARHLVSHMSIGIDSDACEGDTTLLDPTLDVHVDGVVLDNEDDSDLTSGDHQRDLGETKQ